jgi:peptidase A4-like protein
MKMIRTFHHLLFPSILLVTFLCLAGCNQILPLPTPKLPAQPMTHKFVLSPRQALRDATGDFSVNTSNADSGIAVLPGEKVEIFAAGSAMVQAAGRWLAPDGVSTCRESAMPEPSLPCYSVIYSVGITGRAAEVGAHVGFNPDSAGNLFFGINAPNLTANAGSFTITVVIIPSGTFTGLWSAPANPHLVQGTHTTLSAYVFAQDTNIDDVQFMITVPGRAPMPVCTATPAGGDIYACNWDLTLNGDYLHNGPVTIGFTLHGSWHRNSSKSLVNPDGPRTEIIRYALPQTTDIYAGYAATDLEGQTTYQKVTGHWIVPRANCASGETSASSIWVGMTSGSSLQSTLAQLGADSDCDFGTPQYFMWWEMYPAPSVPLDLVVQPGDTITATVTFQQNQFHLSIDDPQAQFHFSTTKPGKVSDTSIAECITEAPTIVDNPISNQGHVAQLTNFGSISISCQLNNNKPIADGPQDVLYQMKTSNNIAKATTSALDQAGNSFTVQWHHG